MNIVIGIVSGLPSIEPDRSQRATRLKQLLEQLDHFMPDLPIVILAQNGGDFKVNNPRIVLHKTIERLGILRARKQLRQILLQTKGDYFIFFDDDAIIQGTPELIKEYFLRINNHPQGYCFVRNLNANKYNPYDHSQLNLCAISRFIFEKEDFPDVDPEKSEGFEDRIYSMTLFCKYHHLEFMIPEGLKTIHFRNTEVVGPSTGSKRKKYKWKEMRKKTEDIEAMLLSFYGLSEK